MYIKQPRNVVFAGEHTFRFSPSKAQIDEATQNKHRSELHFYIFFLSNNSFFLFFVIYFLVLKLIEMACLNQISTFRNPSYSYFFFLLIFLFVFFCFLRKITRESHNFYEKKKISPKYYLKIRGIYIYLFIFKRIITRHNK